MNKWTYSLEVLEIIPKEELVQKLEQSQQKSSPLNIKLDAIQAD